MAVAEDNTSVIAFNTIVVFAGFRISEASIRGRWVWGKPTTSGGPSAIHIQVYPKDQRVVSLAMKTINSEDMKLGSKERQSIYRKRCVAIAKRINEEAVKQHGLSLLMRRDGTPTQKFLRYIRDWHRNESA